MIKFIDKLESITKLIHIANNLIAKTGLSFNC